MAIITYTENFIHPNQLSLNGHNSVTVKEIHTELLPDGRHDILNVWAIMPKTLEYRCLSDIIDNGDLYLIRGVLLNRDGSHFDGLLESI